MMIRKLFVFVWCVLSAGVLCAQENISPELLARMRSEVKTDGVAKVINNAVAATGLKALATNSNNRALDTHFSNEVKTKGITNQLSSGRCWLFSGLNVLRAEMISKYNLGEFQFSQNYCFFYDQLEKSNLFLQSVINTANKPMDDRLVEWLFKYPVTDGGQFTGISDLVTKYGLVPSEVMPETYLSNNTSEYAYVIKLKLREFGLQLRKMAESKAKKEQLQQKKNEMLCTVYQILARCFGVPPTEFTYSLRDADGKVLSTKTYTPQSFYQEHVGIDLKNDYVLLMNDPRHPMHQVYEIDMDRHVYDGANWKYLNLPMDEIKAMAIASIKDSTKMYMSCDVRKEYNDKTGFEDADNYMYGDLLGVTFNMNKEERLRTFASASTHAMTLTAVDLDGQGKPTKWMVENSWGKAAGYNGFIIMTDQWFDDYVFRLVVNKKYVPAKVLELCKQKPTLLPAWDPLFAPEE